MKIPNKKPRRKVVFIVFLTFLAALIALGIWFFLFKTKYQPPQSATKQSPPSDSIVDKQQKDIKEDPSANQAGVNDPTHIPSDNSPSSAAFPTTQPNLEVSITSINQQGKLLSIGTAITPNASGSCVIEVYQPGATTLKQTTTISGDRCANSTIDVSSAQPGAWTVTIKVFVEENVATATKGVNLQ